MNERRAKARLVSSDNFPRLYPLLGIEVVTMTKRSAFIPFFLTLACSSDPDVATPYQPGDITVLGEALGGRPERIEQCGDECATVDDECGDEAAADVVLDAHGDVADVICYEQDVNVQTVSIDRVETAEAGNKTVLVLDGVDDGADVAGNVTISGNNSTVWGEGPDVSVIGGTLKITKNNAVVRGVRIHGDVAVTKNNAQFSMCVIEGDLTVTGNNATFADCVILGDVKIAGVNTVLAQNRFAKSYEIGGKNLTCNENFAFTDADEDGEFDDSELGDAVICTDSKEDLAPQSDVDLDAPDAGAVEEEESKTK